MTTTKTQLHPRNRHRGLYDFRQLIQSCPDLAQFVGFNIHGNESIDYTNPCAVKTLNKSLLKHFYDLDWDIPEHFLCPPIPGRVDYIHHIADLLAVSNGGIPPEGKNISVIDIGVGANCIYPLIGHREYGWSFVGTEINPEAVSIAKDIVRKNGLSDRIEILFQPSPANIFEGILKNREDDFDIALCNPPFHASDKEAKAAAERKRKNLNIKTSALNFGGKSNELWCPGGETAFIQRMIEQSVGMRCKWFTTLVSKEESLPSIYKALRKTNPSHVKTIPMSQGSKKSRIVAWSYRTPN